MLNNIKKKMHLILSNVFTIYFAFLLYYVSDFFFLMGIFGINEVLFKETNILKLYYMQ